MILLEPNTPNQTVEVFIREEQASYEVTFTQQETKESVTFNITDQQQDGLLSFNLPATPVPVKDRWYTLVTKAPDGRIMNYSECFCGENLEQQYSRLEPLFNQPSKANPSYKMPLK